MKIIIKSIIVSMCFFSSACNAKDKDNKQYSEAIYSNHKLDSKVNSAVRTLLEINDSTMLIAITPNGAKIYEIEQQSKQFKQKPENNEVNKLTKYEFYYRTYKNNPSAPSKHKIIVDENGCGSYIKSGREEWIPSPPCPLN